MKAILPLAVIGLLLGCPSSTGPGVAGSTQGEHSSTTSRGGGRESSSAVSSSRATSTSSGSLGSSSSAASNSTGSTGSSSSGSTTGVSGSSSGGLFVCGDVPFLPDGGGCPSGSFVSEVVDLTTCAPIVGAVVQALNANGAPTSATASTTADGTFVLCAPTAGAFTPYVTAPTYGTTYYSELTGAVNSALQPIFMLPQTDLGLIGSVLPGGYQTSQGTLIINVTNSSTCPDPTGWTLELTQVDGGPIPDGGYREVYLGPSDVPDPTLTSTSGVGIAFLYDIDLSSTNFFGVSASNPDAGHCTIVPGTASYTGRIYVTNNAISADLLLVP